jgi:hypothetical protein
LRASAHFCRQAGHTFLAHVLVGDADELNSGDADTDGRVGTGEGDVDGRTGAAAGAGAAAAAPAVSVCVYSSHEVCVETG